jgi:serine/threonine-protein kinase
MEPTPLSSFPTTPYQAPNPSIESDQTLLSGQSSNGPRPYGVQAIPGYEIVKELGRGGMGVVYLARQQSLNRLVALKMILSGNHASKGDLARFKSEAEAVAQLQHPHIVQVIETGEHLGNPWFSMEYVAGGSLEKRLLGRPLPAREAARITSMLADAVSHAHARGVLHRDLKPGNILVQEIDVNSSSIDSTQKPGRTLSGKGNTVVLDAAPEEHAAVGAQTPVTLKVTDFGLAKQMKDVQGLASIKTHAGAVMGSPSYMAPEQAAGDSTHLGPTVDVYALGAMLYELLTGRPPFRASTPLDTIIQVINDEPVPPTRLQPRLPKDIETICLKCLSKDAKKRYPTVAELEADLQRFLKDEPIQARPIGWWERTWKAAKRRPTLAGLIVTAILAVLTIVVLIRVDSARLQKERNNAQYERDLADAARKKAEAAQQKSQKRLEKTVEAVEKLLVRTAGENWARRPELQEERKKLLEDAVEFYQSFLEQEDDDPILRREAAKVYYRMAGLYLLLGDAQNAQQVLNKTKALQESLCTEFPDNPEYKHDMAKTENFLGSAEVMQGEFVKSFNQYEKAAKQAEALAEAFPDNTEFKITLVRSYLSLSNYFLNVNVKSANDYLDKALAIGKSIYEKDDKPYLHQLIYLAPLVEMAQLKLNQNKLTELKVLLEQIDPLVKALVNQAAPTVQDRDQYDMLTAKYVTLNGYALVRAGKVQEGEEELKRGVALIDGMLAQRPKMFMFRMLQMNALQTLGEVQDRQQKPAEARKTIDRSFTIQDQMVKDLPHLTFLKNAGTTTRSNMLVLRAREGAVDSYDRSAEEFLTSRYSQGSLDALYNIACGYAQASHFAEADKKELFAKRSLALLEELYQKKYFTPPRILHILVDPDLAPLRDRDDYKAFLKRFDNTRRAPGKNGYAKPKGP